MTNSFKLHGRGSTIDEVDEVGLHSGSFNESSVLLDCMWGCHCGALVIDWFCHYVRIGDVSEYLGSLGL